MLFLINFSQYQANPGVQAISTITKQKKQLQWECGTACGEGKDTVSIYPFIYLFT